MNNLLDFNRLYLLIRKQWIEQRKTYLISTGALIALLSGLFFCVLFFSKDVISEGQSFQMVLFIISFMVTGTINTSRMFKGLSDKTESISFLTLPASHLEKFLCSVFYSIFVYGFVFLLSFYLVDLVAVTVYNLKNQSDLHLLNVFEGDIFQFKGNFFKGLGFALLVHSYGLWGSIFFKNKNFIKTAFLALGISILFGFLNQGLGFIVFGQPTSIDTFSSAVVGAPSLDALKVELPSALSNIIQVGVWSIVTIGLWTAGYFGLKEREIV